MPVQRSSAAFLLFAVPAFAAPAFSSPASLVRFQGDIKELMSQGLELLRKGDDAAALEKFRAAIASDPSSDKAWDAWREVDQNVWLRMIAKGGEYETIAKTLLLKAQPAMGAAKKDPAAIADLTEKALGADYLERQKAIGALSANHGAYGIQGLAGAMSDVGNDERRIRAMEAAYRIGGSGVPALMALLDSSDAALRRSAAIVLGRIKDARAGAYLAGVAATDADNLVRTEAKAASEACGCKGNAADALVASAMAFLRQTPDFVRAADANNVAWVSAGTKLNDEPISRSLYGAEMARRMAMKALAVAADDGRAVATVAMAYTEAKYQQRLMAAGGAEEEAKALGAKVDAINESLRLCGSDALGTGLTMAIAEGDARLSCTMLEEIAASTVRGSAVPAPVTAALKAPMRDVRLTASLTVAAIDPNFGANSEVVKLLAETVGERVQRIAMIIDENADRRAAMSTAFEGAHWFAAASSSAAEGLARLRRFPGTDLIVVSSSLKDIAVDQVLTEIRTDDRTKGVAMLCVSGGNDKDVEDLKTRLGDKVKGVIRGFDGATMDKAIEGARMNPERERAESMAASAATVLASSPDLVADAKDMVLGSLTVAATSRADAVRLPAIMGLARFGAPAQQDALVSILGDANASVQAKAAAGMALAAMGSRGTGLTDGAQKALTDALGNADPAVRAAAATALGRWPNAAAGDRSKWLATRGATLSTAPKAEGGAAN